MGDLMKNPMMQAMLLQGLMGGGGGGAWGGQQQGNGLGFLLQLLGIGMPPGGGQQPVGPTTAPVPQTPPSVPAQPQAAAPSGAVASLMAQIPGLNAAGATTLAQRLAVTPPARQAALIETARQQAIRNIDPTPNKQPSQGTGVNRAPDPYSAWATPAGMSQGNMWQRQYGGTEYEKFGGNPWGTPAPARTNANGRPTIGNIGFSVGGPQQYDFLGALNNLAGAKKTTPSTKGPMPRYQPKGIMPQGPSIFDYL